MKTKSPAIGLVKFAVMCVLVLGAGYYIIPALVTEPTESTGTTPRTTKNDDSVVVMVSITRSRGRNTVHITYGHNGYAPVPFIMKGRTWNKALRVQRGETVWVTGTQLHGDTEQLDCFIHRGKEQLTHDATNLNGDTARCQAIVF